jgi:hypothetical protein
MLPLPISKYIILFFVDKHFEKREKTTQKRKRDNKKTPLLLNFSRVGSNYPNRVKWVLLGHLM